MSAIPACRTAALGGHVEQYDCGATRIAYNSGSPIGKPSCCQCHTSMFFTLPAPVGEIAFQNKAAVYTILCRVAAEALATMAADPRHLGASSA